MNSPRNFTLSIITFLIMSFCAFAAEAPVQTVKGTIINKNSRLPVPGLHVVLLNSKLGALTLKDGTFKIKNVPVGRYNLKVSGLGYNNFVTNIVLTSGKEQQLDIEVEESIIQTDTIKVSAKKDNFTPINESSIVSSTVFSLDDVERFAGSRMDPARMAQNYAGVLGADDRRNDIIVRGGSPTELLWRVDGLDIPNPNHYATQGSSGGPINALNHNLLSNSDFFTGAFPAEYGDKMSAVFDLNVRKGNTEKYEFLGEFGFNGLEFGAQGPIGIKNSSFIINYRYSFFDLLEKLGVNFGFAGVPRYQDLMFKNYIEIDPNNKLSLTGLFGKSDIYIQDSKLDTTFTGDFDVKNGTDIYTLGLNWQSIYSEKSYANLLLGFVSTNYRTDVDSITTDGNHKVLNLTPWYSNYSKEGYFNLKYSLYLTASIHHYFSLGLEAKQKFYNLSEERFTFGYFNKERWVLNMDGKAQQYSGFINWRWRINDNLTTNLGIHSEYLSISKKSTFEPRFALNYKLSDLDNLSLGLGVHSQSLPLITYFYKKGNENLNMMHSTHLVVGWNRMIAEDAQIKLEAYYKDINNIPLLRDSISSFSFINIGTTFGSIGGQNIALVSGGLGKAYGAELSLTKNFSNGYYINATASYSRQQFKGSDNIWRFGAFDNIFIINLLAGYEWNIKSDVTLGFSFKFTTAGGSPYTPIDVNISRLSGTTYLSDKDAFSLRNPNYTKFDLRIDLRQNFKSFSIVSYVSAENITNQKNVYFRQYSVQNDRVDVLYQTPFFFVGGFRIEF